MQNSETERLKLEAGVVLAGQWSLLQPVGRGLASVVWQARHTTDGSLVAVKFFASSLVQDREALAELRSAIKAAGQVAHPSIVAPLQVLVEGGRAAVITPWIQGENLDALRDPRKSVEFAQLSTWLASVGGALKTAHQQHVVHGALKPANIFVQDDGKVVLADLGIARWIADALQRTGHQAAVVGGTPYWSPAQAMGEPVVAADDVYALGAVLYDLLTGRPPFFSGNISLQIASKVPPTIAARRLELGTTGEPVPEEWEQMIAACLAKEAMDRPRSVAVVLGVLGIVPLAPPVAAGEPAASETASAAKAGPGPAAAKRPSGNVEGETSLDELSTGQTLSRVAVAASHAEGLSPAAEPAAVAPKLAAPLPPPPASQPAPAPSPAQPVPVETESVPSPVEAGLPDAVPESAAASAEVGSEADQLPASEPELPPAEDPAEPAAAPVPLLEDDALDGHVAEDPAPSDPDGADSAAEPAVPISAAPVSASSGGGGTPSRTANAGRPASPPSARGATANEDYHSPYEGRAKPVSNPWMLIVAVVLVLLGGGGIWWWQSSHQAAASQVNRAEIESRIINFPLDSTDAQLADFSSRLVADELSADPEQQERLKKLWAVRKAAILEVREKMAAEKLAAVRGSVLIRVQPEGAEVLVDDGVPAKAPANVGNLKLGRHGYVVRAPGYETQRGEIQVKDAEPLYAEVVLTRSKGKLVLNSTPADSAWTLRGLDGIDVARRGSTGGTLELPIGRYSVKFTRPGHEPIEQIVTVESGGPAEFTADFPEGGLSVLAPEGTTAAITVDGVARGQSPLKLNLPVGEHIVEVAFGSGVKESHRVLIEKNQAVDLPLHPPVAASAVPGGTPPPETKPATDTPPAAIAIPPSAPPAASPPADVDYDAIFTLANVTVRPKPLKQVAPKMPQDFRHVQEEGEVVVDAIIDREGNVYSAKIKSSTHGMLDLPTLDAVREWRFTPAEKDGHKVAVRVVIPFSFKAL